MSLLVLGVDPGERTGVALIQADEGGPHTILHREVYGGLDGFTQWWNMGALIYDVLVVENYIPRAGVSQKNSEAPQRIIGWLSQFDPIMQPPSGRKNAVSDDVLKRLGLYLPGEPNRNAREAVRHCVVYLKHSKHIPTLKAGWGNAPTG